MVLTCITDVAYDGTAHVASLQPFLMSEIHCCLHFSSFQIKTQLSLFFRNVRRWPFWIFKVNLINFLLSFFLEWPPVAILDLRNSFSVTFLVNSDQNTTFNFFSKGPPHTHTYAHAHTHT